MGTLNLDLTYHKEPTLTRLCLYITFISNLKASKLKEHPCHHVICMKTRIFTYIHFMGSFKICCRYIGKMDSNKRKTLRIKAQMPYVQSLKVFQDLIPNSIQRKFTLKYGRILYLLGVHVKVEAIISVTQFYDPPIRFLLFKKFQLAPTLEEFGLYLDLPKDRRGPYIGMGKKVKPKNLVMTLRIYPKYLLLHYKEDMDI